jgi:type IV pilus assembly protein PilM
MAPSTGIGIDIGTTTLRIAQVRRSGGRFLLVNVFSLRIGGTAVDGREAVRDPQMQEFIRGRLTDPALRRGILGISGKEVLNRYMHFPAVPPWKLAMMVDFEIKQGDPESEGFAYDYRLLALPKGLSDEYTVLAPLAKNLQLESYIAAVRGAGIRPQQVAPAQAALYNACLASGDRLTTGTVLAADIGAARTEIMIAGEGGLYFIRTLPIGGAMFTQALADEFGLSPEKAEDLKLAKGRILPEGDEGSGEEERRISATLKRAALQVSSQIQASIRFAAGNIRLKDLKVDAYYLTGGGARLKGLLPFWQTAFQLPVKIINPLRGLVLSEFPARRLEEITEMPSVYTTAIGLALGAFGGRMINMNILPEKEKRRLAFLNHTLPLVAALVLLLAGSALFSMVNWDLRREGRTAQDGITAAGQAMDGRLARLKAGERAMAEFLDQYAFVTGQGAESRDVLRVLDCFQEERPEEVRLRRIASQGGGAGPGKVALTVLARESETASANTVFEEFKIRLMRRPEIAAITVDRIEDLEGGDRRTKAIAFTVTLKAKERP